MPIYLKYGDIKGDVTESGHTDWIELSSAQFGTFRYEPGRPTGHTIEEIVATKGSDRASQPLMRESLGGKATAATIDFAERNGHVYLAVNMTGTLISSWSVSGGGDRPTESLTLNFTKVEFKST